MHASPGRYYCPFQTAGKCWPTNQQQTQGKTWEPGQQFRPPQKAWARKGQSPAGSQILNWRGPSAPLRGSHEDPPKHSSPGSLQALPLQPVYLGPCGGRGAHSPPGERREGRVTRGECPARREPQRSSRANGSSNCGRRANERSSDRAFERASERRPRPRRAVAGRPAWAAGLFVSSGRDITRRPARGPGGVAWEFESRGVAQVTTPPARARPQGKGQVP